MKIMNREKIEKVISFLGAIISQILLLFSGCLLTVTYLHSTGQLDTADFTKPLPFDEKSSVVIVAIIILFLAYAYFSSRLDYKTYEH